MREGILLTRSFLILYYDGKYHDRDYGLRASSVETPDVASLLRSCHIIEGSYLECPDVSESLYGILSGSSCKQLWANHDRPSKYDMDSLIHKCGFEREVALRVEQLGFARSIWNQILLDPTSMSSILSIRA